VKVTARRWGKRLELSRRQRRRPEETERWRASRFLPFARRRVGQDEEEEEDELAGHVARMGT
jgi:hypothetical protein